MHKIVKSIYGSDKILDELNELYQKPKKEKRLLEGPTFQVFEPGLIQQADLLFLPHDNGFKYALVVVDNCSKLCDAEPLKEKDAASVLKAFQKIYLRNIISIPKIQIEVDSGGEFKGVVARWFEDQKIRIRVAEPNRHRQQGLVEYKNKVIGAVLLQLQAIEELKTHKANTKWVKVLPTVIKFINEDLPPPITTQKSDLPYSNKYNEDLLSIGQEVRTALNHPIEVNSGKKLHGDFRSSDIRFSKTKHKITDVILKPSFPPMYIVDGRRTAITRNEILV